MSAGRDALAALANAASLLGSRRLGVRAVERALPSLAEAAAELTALLGGDGAAALPDALRAHARARLGPLVAALAGPPKLDVGRRLALEALARPLVPELETMVLCLELVEATPTLAARSTVVDLHELLARRDVAPHVAPGAPALRVVLALPAEASVAARPGPTVSLVELAAALVVPSAGRRGAEAEARIVGVREGEVLELRVTRNAGTRAGEATTVLARRAPVPGLAGAAVRVGDALGIEVVMASDAEVVLRLPAAW